MTELCLGWKSNSTLKSFMYSGRSELRSGGSGGKWHQHTEYLCNSTWSPTGALIKGLIRQIKRKQPLVNSTNGRWTILKHLYTWQRETSRGREFGLTGSKKSPSPVEGLKQDVNLIINLYFVYHSVIVSVFPVLFSSLLWFLTSALARW